MNNQLMNIEDNEMNIFEQGAQKPAYCSIVAECFEDKAKIFNAMTSPDERLRNHINEIIKIRDVYCEIVECTNKDTGETSEAPRVVLIDTEGQHWNFQQLEASVYGVRYAHLGEWRSLQGEAG